MKKLLNLMLLCLMFSSLAFAAEEFVGDTGCQVDEEFGPVCSFYLCDIDFNEYYRYEYYMDRPDNARFKDGYDKVFLGKCPESIVPLPVEQAPLVERRLAVPEQNVPEFGVIGGAIAFLGAGWYAIRRKRK